MPTQTRPPTRSLRELSVDERIRLEGREERALAALAWLERVTQALRDERPERLETLAAAPPDERVFERLSGFVEQQRWAQQLASLEVALDRMGVPPGALGVRLQQLVSRARITWLPGRWRWWRREERTGPWVRVGDHSFHLERAEAIALDAQWAMFDGVRVAVSKLRELGVHVSAATFPVPVEAVVTAPTPEPAPPKPAKRKSRASVKRKPVITSRGVAWGSAAMLGVLFALQARSSASARPVAALFVLVFLAFVWRSRRAGRAPLRKKRRSRQLDLSFIPLLQRDTPHPVEKPGKTRRKRERKPGRR